MVERNPLDEHITHAATVERAGVAAPAQWVAVHCAFTDYLKMSTPCRDELVDAIINPSKDDDDVATLRALAISESAVNATVVAVNKTVASAVHARLVDLYKPAAVETYAKISEQFNACASELAKLAKVTDVDTTDADWIVSQPAKCHDAWKEAPLIAGRLGALLPALQASAALADHDTHNNETLLLALVCDPAGAARADIWSAWSAKGRTGRWGPLLAAGATIRAADLKHLKPYHRAADPAEDQPAVATG